MNNLSNVFQSFKQTLVKKVLDSVTGNEKNCHTLAKDISTQIFDNMKSMEVDAIRVEMFFGGRDLGYKKNYGTFPINRNELLNFKMLPDGLLTFEKIADYLPKQNTTGKIVVKLDKESANIQILNLENENELIIDDDLETFLFNCLFQTPEKREEIEHSIINAIDGIENDEAEKDEEIQEAEIVEEKPENDFLNIMEEKNSEKLNEEKLK